MSIKSGLSFSQTTSNALQEAAALFRQNKVDDAYHVLHENIFLPQAQGKLTKAQSDAVYRSMIPDPLSAPETPFSKRSCIPAIALRGHAIKDLVAHYDLPEGHERSAILKAANILETEGDEEKAWKILHESVVPSGSNDVLIKEVHRIMLDSLRIPTSSFLQKHVKNHPKILENNLLRAETLECLSSHFFDQEVVKGAKVQLESPILEFRTKTRSALQQAAQLYREDKIKEAQELLKSAIQIPYEKGELTKAQVNFVYKSLENPYNPKTEFAKRQFQCLLVLRGQALRDLVKFYSGYPEGTSARNLIDDVKIKNSILKAASLLETQGDLEGARKVLHDAIMSFDLRDIWFADAVYHIMHDNLSCTSSLYLKQRINSNPFLVDENRLRARSLESLSNHIFDDDVVRGEPSKCKIFEGTEKAILAKEFAHLVLPQLVEKELATFAATSKSAKETVIKSLKNRKE